jgi:RNA polymerase sigma factor (sigma-70 family)
MKVGPSTHQNGAVSFATTHWSVIAAACSGGALEGERADAALAQLCRDYWPPLYSFVRGRGFNSDDAQDLVQGFFAYFLQHKAYAQTDRNKGKFRSFLLVSLKHYMADAWNHDHAVKRGGRHEFVLLDEELHLVEMQSGNGSVGALDEEREYELRWAAALVACAMNRLDAQFNQGAKAFVYGELKRFITGGTGLPSQEAVAQSLGIPIETLRSHLSRMRARYRELLREEVARTIAVTDDVDEELRHLLRILTAAF